LGEDPGKEVRGKDLGKEMSHSPVLCSGHAYGVMAAEKKRQRIRNSEIGTEGGGGKGPWSAAL